MAKEYVVTMMQTTEKFLSPPKKLVGGGTQRRIGYIDALKGFAALCVVLGHVINGYLDAGSYPEASTALYRIYNIIYAFHMPLFLTISGFVFQRAYFDENGLAKQADMKRQIMNLLLNYISFSLLYGLVKIIFGRWINQGISFSDLVMIWCKPIDLYWYLYDLIIYYLLFSIEKIRKTPGIVMTALLLSASCLSGFVSIRWFDISRLCHNAFFFYLGINLTFILRQMDKRRWSWVVGLCITGVLFIAFWNGGSYTEQAKEFSYNQLPIVNTFIALGAVLLLWRLFQKVRPLAENRVLRLLGRHSLEIYLIHCFLTAMFRVLFKRLGFNNAFMSVLLNAVLSTAIPLLISFLCTRIGIDKLLFRPATLLVRKKKK